MVAVTALGLSVSATAEALTFGAMIKTRSANNTTSCAYPPYWLFANPYATSCDVVGIGTGFAKNYRAAENGIVPLPDPRLYRKATISGEIIRVRIKTGPMPRGPAKARLKILMATRLGQTVACCTGESVSATFTLLPNRVNNLRTNLPVFTRVRGQYVSYDMLALQMLDRYAPFPAQVSNLSALVPYLSSIYAPPIGVGKEHFLNGYSAPFIPLIEADLRVNTPRRR